MSPLDRGRSWIWAAVIVEIIGLSVDAVWHGLIGAEIEPQTRGEMVRHLATVHLVLYVGVGMRGMRPVAARSPSPSRARPSSWWGRCGTLTRTCSSGRTRFRSWPASSGSRW